LFARQAGRRLAFVEAEELTEAQERELEADLEALRAELEATLGLAQTGSKPVSLDEPIGRVSRVDAL
jgi:hypothetical protein